MTNTSRAWGDEAGQSAPGTEVVCPHGHAIEVRTATARLVRCAQCASADRVTWVLVNLGSGR
jgi:hypothetical protein